MKEPGGQCKAPRLIKSIMSIMKHVPYILNLLKCKVTYLLGYSALFLLSFTCGM